MNGLYQRYGQGRNALATAPNLLRCLLHRRDYPIAADRYQRRHQGSFPLADVA